MQESSDHAQSTPKCPASLCTALREFAEEVGGSAVLPRPQQAAIRAVIIAGTGPTAAALWIGGGKYAVYLVDEAALTAAGCSLTDLPARYKALPSHLRRHTAEMDTLAWLPADRVVAAAAAAGQGPQGPGGGGASGLRRAAIGWPTSAASSSSLRPHVKMAFDSDAMRAWIAAAEPGRGSLV
jgi:hypothetical protein